MRNEESKLQIACVKWFRYQYPEYARQLFAVPNGGNRNLITAKILKAEGVLPGVADLIFLKPNAEYHALCIEMKYGKGKQSELQKEWQFIIEGHGYKYEVCNSLESFINTINTYINGNEQDSKTIR